MDTHGHPTPMKHKRHPAPRHIFQAECLKHPVKRETRISFRHLTTEAETTKQATASKNASPQSKHPVRRGAGVITLRWLARRNVAHTLLQEHKICNLESGPIPFQTSCESERGLSSNHMRFCYYNLNTSGELKGVSRTLSTLQQSNTTYPSSNLQKILEANDCSSHFKLDHK